MQNCEMGYVWSSSTSSCVQCSTLTSTQCSSTCTGYYFFTNTNGTNTTENSGCSSCENTYDLGCTSCDGTNCLTCATGLILNSKNTYCKDSICADNVPSQCFRCLDANTCDLCQPGYTVNS